MSYVVEVRAVGESRFIPNGIRHPTHEAADNAGFRLMCRWFGAEEYRVVESPDPVNVDADGNLLPEVHP